MKRARVDHRDWLFVDCLRPSIHLTRVNGDACRIVPNTIPVYGVWLVVRMNVAHGIGPMMNTRWRRRHRRKGRAVAVGAVGHRDVRVRLAHESVGAVGWLQARRMRGPRTGYRLRRAELLRRHRRRRSEPSWRRSTVLPGERARLVQAWIDATNGRTSSRTERTRLHRRIGRLKELYLDGEIDRAEFQTRKGELSERLAALPTDDAEDRHVGDRLAGYLTDVATAWAATPDERNRLTARCSPTS